MDDPLEALDPEQRAVAESLEGPVVVWAGAGTGKTRAVTHRIAHAVQVGAHDPRRSLAVTFTTRAAGEMRERLRILGVDGVQVRTFHSAALRQLRHFWPRVVGGAPPELVGRAAPLVAEAASRCRLPSDPAVVRDLAAEIAWAKQMEISAERYPEAALLRTPPVSLADTARAYAAYDEIKSERGLIDFDDVLLMTVGALAERPDIADEVRAAYRWFTVDEFQDVSPVQSRLLDLWLGDRDDVCVVGDAAQTIYSFAGANDRFLRDFPARFPGAAQVRLYRTYRSTEQIVTLSNRVLAAGAGEGGLSSQVGAGPEPIVESFDDEVAEAHAVAERIERLMAEGLSPRDIAVLVRINGQMPAFEEALAERGIPVVLRGGERFFDRGEVREALTRLRGAARTNGTEPAASGVASVLSVMGYSSEPPRSTGAVRERWESLSALVALAESLAPDADLATFVIELDRRADAQHAPVADGVVLATIHAAKGLEWEAVVVAGLAEGSLPHAQALAEEGLAEERRLFYVAITRARRHLVLTWSRSRHPGGRGQRQRSRFLDEAQATVAGPAGAASVSRGAGRARRSDRRGPASCRVCGRALVTGAERARMRCRTCPTTAQESLIDELKAWRLQRAREREVPAYVVFTDATLDALAESMPSDIDGLLAISGIGPDKAGRYGDQILELLDQHRA
ncbi:MAG: ATP-dependent DNA helicase [Actinomycetales bacterium mxb001]|nr:MAG: ATP-dependent DNA helicase [Actinomycetales bacterium mxb001]